MQNTIRLSKTDKYRHRANIYPEYQRHNNHQKLSSTLYRDTKKADHKKVTRLSEMSYYALFHQISLNIRLYVVEDTVLDIGDIAWNELFTDNILVQLNVSV